MSLKDELKVVKEELTTDEKLLEQAFQLEKFYKKHKVKIYALLILLTVGVAGYKINNYLVEQKLQKANSALLKLQANPKDSEALKVLKENNPKLYELYSYSVAANNQDAKALKSLNSNNDVLSDVINYHKHIVESKVTDSKYYKNLVLVERAYLLIKEGKKKDAKNILAQVPKNSPVAPVARLLEHYTIE